MFTFCTRDFPPSALRLALPPEMQSMHSRYRQRRLANIREHLELEHGVGADQVSRYEGGPVQCSAVRC